MRFRWAVVWVKLFGWSRATWPSGKAGVCKTPIAGSNPAVASIFYSPFWWCRAAVILQRCDHQKRKRFTPENGWTFFYFLGKIRINAYSSFALSHFLIWRTKDGLRYAFSRAFVAMLWLVPYTYSTPVMCAHQRSYRSPRFTIQRCVR